MTPEDRAIIERAKEILAREEAELKKLHFFTGSPTVRWSLPYNLIDSFGRRLPGYAGVTLNPEQAATVAALIF